ncbi:MAG TPA: RNA polymerase factor sigma-54, partial [Acidiferrobacterales bacterium]|nr:RNA polymerase factor sigma-54 [Acidiferrobacterales bacterium]
MKQSLDLKLGQHLTITPQLQQAIRLLQLSSLELQQEIQEALENNPLLEELEDETATREMSEAPIEETVTADSGDDSESGEAPASDELPVDRDAAIDDDSLRDELTGNNDDWEDNSESLSASATRNEGGDGLPDIDARNSAPTTLREHLLWQMQMAIFSPTDRRIAEAVIDAINEDGYLTCTL